MINNKLKIMLRQRADVGTRPFGLGSCVLPLGR